MSCWRVFPNRAAHTAAAFLSFALAASTSPARAEDSPSAPATQLQDVVVAADLDASRAQIAPSLGALTYTIGPNQIQSVPQGENAPFSQILLRAPGVVADSFGEVHVRGEHGGLTYRINGVLLPEGLNGFGQEIDTRLISSVTLIDGSLPAQFGFRTAGIVDVTTKSGDTLKGGEFSLTGGSYDTFNPALKFGGTSGKWDYFVSLSYKHSDLGIENPTSSVRPLHDYTAQEKAFAYLSYRIDQTSRISLLLNASYATFQLPNTPGLPQMFQLSGIPSASSSAVNENQKEQNYYAVLSYQKTIDNLFYQLSAFTRYGGIHFTPDSVRDLIFQGVAGEVKNTFFTNGLEFDASYILNDRHTLRAGVLADYTVEQLDTNTSVFAVDSAGTQLSNHPFTIVDNRGLTGVTAGIYLQDEWRLTDHWTLNYGARYDRFDSSFDHEGQLSPRVNLVWKINDATTAHLGYSRYFTPPSVQYVSSATIQKFKGTSNAPENDLDNPTPVERAHYFDIGLSRQITSAWQVTVDAYYKKAQNLIDLGQFGNAVILTPFSYRTGTVYGAELSTIYKRGNFSAFANFSFVNTSARDINSAQYQFPSDELAYIVTHNIKLDHEGEYTVSAGATYTLGDTRFILDVLYGYGLRKGFANTQKNGGYLPVNLGIEHVFHPKIPGVHAMKVRIDCLNVFDESYRLRDGSGLGITASQYGQRRTLLAGFSVEF